MKLTKPVVLYCTQGIDDKVAKTVEMRNCIVLADFDHRGNLIGVKVLDNTAPKVKGEKAPIRSKRQIESDKRAQLVAQEVRRMFENADCYDWERLYEFVNDWMRVTGKSKYAKPFRRGKK